jgi:hypothetical protein
VGAQAIDRLRWLLDTIADPGDITVADIEPLYDISGWRSWSFEQELEQLRDNKVLLRPFEVSPFRVVSDDQAVAVVSGSDGKQSEVTVWTEPDPPHRIVGIRVIPAPPEGLVVRDATLDDAEAATALERRSPIKLGDTFMYFERGDDFFAPARLMEECTIYVGELEGVLAGTYWGAQQPVLVGGEHKVLFVENKVRIDPESRRGGVFWGLCVYGRDRYAKTSDSIAFYVSPDNAGVQKFVENTPKWTVQPQRVLVPCGAGDAAPRRATKDDAQVIVDVLNACHGGEELFVPYTVESLTARLERDPGQYTWSDLRLGDGAVLGVGRIPVTITKVTGDERRSTTRAMLLDHGFASGHEADYEALLRATGAELAADGVTHLAAFTSEGSSTLASLQRMSDHTERYDFWAFEIPSPPDLATNGFYVDPVYF